VKESLYLVHLGLPTVDNNTDSVIHNCYIFFTELHRVARTYFAAIGTLITQCLQSSYYVIIQVSFGCPIATHSSMTAVSSISCADFIDVNVCI